MTSTVKHYDGRQTCWCRAREARIAHQLPRGIEAREVAQLGDQDDRTRELDAPQRLDRFDDRVQAPGLHLLVQLAFQALEPLVRFPRRRGALTEGVEDREQSLVGLA